MADCFLSLTYLFRGYTCICGCVCSADFKPVFQSVALIGWLIIAGRGKEEGEQGGHAEDKNESFSALPHEASIS